MERPPTRNPIPGDFKTLGYPLYWIIAVECSQFGKDDGAIALVVVTETDHRWTPDRHHWPFEFPKFIIHESSSYIILRQLDVQLRTEKLAAVLYLNNLFTSSAKLVREWYTHARSCVALLF